MTKFQELKDRVLLQVCTESLVTEKQLRGKARTGRVVWARYKAAYMLQKECDMNNSQIGRFINRHHTTIPTYIHRYEEKLVPKFSTEFKRNIPLDMRGMLKSTYKGKRYD